MSGVGISTPGRARRLVLASRSPRRRSLLDEHGFGHEAHSPGFEDSVLEPGAVTPAQWVASLAYLKAWCKALDLCSRSEVGLVLGADTACLMSGRLIGTPRDGAEAEQMIRRFINAEHDVLTGVALVEAAPGGAVERSLFVDRARVRLGALSEEQIRAYIASGEWEGKAGAYNYRERIVAGWPLSHQGDETTIMGLPMRELTKRLTALGIDGAVPPLIVGRTGPGRTPGSSFSGAIAC